MIHKINGMEIITAEQPFPLIGEMAATVGFFDGVHAGHRYLLEQLRKEADARKLPSMAITFTQYPQSILRAKFRNICLNTLDERIERLSFSGIDYCLLLDFDRPLSQLTAKDFIQQKLKKEWNIRFLLIGYDNRFGKRRLHSFRSYVKYGADCGMEIIQASELPDFQVSSTNIRNCLLANNLEEANRMLSYFYRLEGKVTTGDRIGRKFGFPTANIKVNDKDKILPSKGVYAAFVHSSGKKYSGMVYIGRRPTKAGRGEKRIEVHLFDFTGDLYGKNLQLELVGFIRKEKRFGSFEDLKKQLFSDRETAIKVLGLTCKSCEVKHKS